MNKKALTCGVSAAVEPTRRFCSTADLTAAPCPPSLRTAYALPTRAKRLDPVPTCRLARRASGFWICKADSNNAVYADQQILGYGPAWSPDSQKVTSYDGLADQIRMFDLADQPAVCLPLQHGRTHHLVSRQHEVHVHRYSARRKRLAHTRASRRFIVERHDHPAWRKRRT